MKAGARVLVVGGAGFVGSHCLKALVAAGFDCTVLDNLSTGHRDFVKGAPLIVGDIRDHGLLVTLIKSHRFDAVVHFAALAYVGDSVRDPAKYYDVNVNGTRVLLDAMVKGGIDKIVFSSSCAVYGIPRLIPVSEAESLSPVSPYGRTKLISEQMMDDYGDAYGLRSIRLRYFNAAGADPCGDIGEDHDPETHLIPLILDVALGRREAILVLGSEYPTRDGTAVRDFVHVSDLADAHVRSLNYLFEGGRSTAVNLGSGFGASVLDVIEAASLVTCRPIPRQYGNRRPGDPPALVADSALACHLLGWRPHMSELPVLLQHAWAWHSKRRSGKP